MQRKLKCAKRPRPVGNLGHSIVKEERGEALLLTAALD